MNENERVNSLAEWYLSTQLDFDRTLIRLRFESIKTHFKGRTCLELGPADGVMTELLLDCFESITAVDGSRELLDAIPSNAKLHKVHSLFETYTPDMGYDTVIMEHILEHIEEPGQLLRLGAKWLKPGGRLIAGVPNANSLHRLAAVKMGLLDFPGQLNARDHELGHRRVYTPESFRKEIEDAGLEIELLGGVFLKPVSNGQIQQHWTGEMVKGFYELGKDFPELSAEIFAVCKVS